MAKRWPQEASTRTLAVEAPARVPLLGGMGVLVVNHVQSNCAFRRSETLLILDSILNSKSSVNSFRYSRRPWWAKMSVSLRRNDHFCQYPSPSRGTLRGPGGPSWGPLGARLLSKLGLWRLRTCAFRVCETLFFASWGHLEVEEPATNTKWQTEVQKMAKRWPQEASAHLLGGQTPARMPLLGGNGG